MRQAPRNRSSKRLQSLINPQPIIGAPHWRAVHLDSVGSTSDELRHFAENNVADRVWLTAGEQLSGKGRRGRAWHSPKGNFYGSLYLENPCALSQVGFFPLVVAVAVHGAIESALKSSGVETQIKWPNDVLIDGSKCCGMLLEADRKGDTLSIIVGCGTNLVAFPDDTPYPATSLKHCGADITPSDMLHYLVSSFDEVLNIWSQGKGLQTIREMWLSHARGIGEEITVNLAEGPINGIFNSIDNDGVLQLKSDNGHVKQIAAGDVFFPHLKTGRQNS